VRIDVAFRDAWLAIEIDGYRWHASASAWASDQERRNAMIAAGWRVLPIAARSIEERPREVTSLIRALAASTARTR
jgi:very-short-patch-repair endonuclease